MVLVSEETGGWEVNCIYCGREVSGDHDTCCICGNCKPGGAEFTLRDFFAGCALIASAAGFGLNGRRGSVEAEWNYADEAQGAYQQADVMMKERES